jgi:hypothetical protein
MPEGRRTPVGITRVARALACASLGLVGLLVVLSPARTVGSGAARPQVTFPLLDGGTLDLGALEGQVVVVRFLASW